MSENKEFKKIDEYFNNLSTEEFLKIVKRNGFGEIMPLSAFGTDLLLNKLKETKEILEKTISVIIESNASAVYNVRHKIDEIDDIIEKFK